MDIIKVIIPNPWGIIYKAEAKIYFLDFYIDAKYGIYDFDKFYSHYVWEGPRWQSGNTLASHLCGRGSIPVMAVSGKAGSCLPLVGSLQYRTLANYMYWFPLPFQLLVVI